MKSFLLSLLLSVFACGCLSASVTEPRACDTVTLSFPGAPANPGIQIPPVTQSFTLSVGFGKDLLTKVYLLDGQLTLANGGDFGFLDEIMITVSNSNGGDDLPLWDSQHNSGTVLDVAASDANLADYIDGNGNFALNVTVSSQHPPTNGWDLDVALCVSAEVDKTYP